MEYEIKQRLGIISANEKTGWSKELNLVSWNGNAPKYDIREWNAEHEKCGKGSTFTKEELSKLKDILSKID